ncbi:MAG TPA: DUF3343 domain-containing protein [Anaerovoracaceae bacterium]|nr:DUF3343 domain-containing protein [Anaerovoracaceae bacterium]
MREKELKLVITFHTTTAAMAMEKACNARSLPGRLIPVPREITSGCGMAWSAPPESREALEQAACSEGIEVVGVYQLTI